MDTEAKVHFFYDFFRNDGISPSNVASNVVSFQIKSVLISVGDFIGVSTASACRIVHCFPYGCG